MKRLKIWVVTQGTLPVSQELTHKCQISVVNVPLILVQAVRWLQMLTWQHRSSLSNSWYRHQKAWMRSIFAVRMWGHTQNLPSLCATSCCFHHLYLGLIISALPTVTPVCRSFPLWSVSAGAAICSVDGWMSAGLQRQESCRQQFPERDPKYPFVPGYAKVKLRFQWQRRCQQRKHQSSQSGITTLP